MGGFGSGKWADVMTRKATTGRCRTLNAKRLTCAGVFDGDQPVTLAWVNEWGQEAGSLTLSRQTINGGVKVSHLAGQKCTA